MRIVHVLRAPVGGLFRHVVDLAVGQAALGHRVGLITDSLTGSARSDEILATLKPKLALGLSQIPIRRQPGLGDFVALGHIAERLREADADVVHGHGAKGGALARLATAPRNALHVYTPHGGSLHDAVGNRLHILMEKMLMRYGNLYLFESAYSRDAYLRKIGTPHEMRVVYNGVGQSEFEPITLDDEATDIVFLGELRTLKGVDVLIDAIAALRNDGLDLTATLVGDGPDAAAFRAQVSRLQLDDAIRFRSSTPTRAALALGRLVVVPSRAESLPYVVLEAAAAGKPLIATRVGGIPEIFGLQANRLVPANNAPALARAVADLIDNPAAAEHNAQMLQSRIADKFCADAMVRSILASYQQAFRAMQQVDGARRHSEFVES